VPRASAGVCFVGSFSGRNPWWHDDVASRDVSSPVHVPWAVAVRCVSRVGAAPRACRSTACATAPGPGSCATAPAPAPAVTGRVGWAWDRWLIYAKGGAAWAGDKYSADIPIFPEHLEASETRTGWTVGGGVEWAFWDNWSAKLEYDFYDFGTRGVTFIGTFAGVPEVVSGIDIKQTINAVKFGINYRFDWGKGKAPVVARY
jgi:opacity protein-like surface antigen